MSSGRGLLTSIRITEASGFERMYNQRFSSGLRLGDSVAGVLQQEPYCIADAVVRVDDEGSWQGHWRVVVWGHEAPPSRERGGTKMAMHTRFVW